MFEEEDEDEDDIAWNAARGEFTHGSLSGGGWWNHSTVTARADADQSRRGCWIPGIPPCWRGSSFSKQPPPSQPLSLEALDEARGARGQGPDPRPDAPIRSARCFWVEWHDSARLAHENWSKGMPCRPTSAIRHPPSATRPQYEVVLRMRTAYLLELRALQDLDC